MHCRPIGLTTRVRKREQRGGAASPAWQKICGFLCSSVAVLLFPHENYSLRDGYRYMAYINLYFYYINAIND
jgi:hypothetical protein